MKPFGVGVLGATGYIGVPYRREIRACPGEARIVALAARRKDLLEAAKREDEAELATDDWRQVVEHPDVDLVIVATPDALHYEPVLAARAAGKHVICEKPLGRNVREAREMWEAYEGSGLAHFVPFWTRYVPVFARAREIVRRGDLGRVRAVVYRWHNPRPPGMPFTWRDDAAVSAGGSVADVGSHAYDTLRWMLEREAVRVLAHAAVVADPKPDLGTLNLEEALAWGETHRRTEAESLRKGTAYDYGAAAFEFDGGTVGVLVVSHAPFVRKGLAPELELHGEDASLAVDRLRRTLTLARGEETPVLFETLERDLSTSRFGDHVFPALRAALRGDPSDHPDLRDGWLVQRFTDACLRSAREGRWVALEELDAD